MRIKKIQNRVSLILYVMVIGALLCIANYIASKKYIRLDLTEHKIYTIAPVTKAILQSLDDVVVVKAYFTRDVPPRFAKTQATIKDVLDEYKAHAHKNFRIVIIDPSKSDTLKRRAINMGIAETEMESYEKDKVQAVKGFLGIAVLCGDKKEVISYVNDPDNIEYVLTQAILKVRRKTLPTVGILEPNLPTSSLPLDTGSVKRITHYKPLYETLEKDYILRPVYLAKSDSIDSGLKALIIAGGSQFSKNDLFKIDQYFMKGGALVVLVDAVNVSWDYGLLAMRQESQIVDLLQHYGVTVEHDLVVDEACGQVMVPREEEGYNVNVPYVYPYYVKPFPACYNQKIHAMSTLSEMVVPWTSSLTIHSLKKKSPPSKFVDTLGATCEVLLKSSPRSWVSSGAFDLDPRQKYTQPKEGFKQSVLMAYLYGNFTSMFTDKDSTNHLVSNNSPPRITSTTFGKLVVVGSSTFLTNQFAIAPNTTWLHNVVDWLTATQSLAEIRGRLFVDRPVMKNMLSNNTTETMVVKVINIVFMPLLFVILGLWLYNRRQEKWEASKDDVDGNSVHRVRKFKHLPLLGLILFLSLVGVMVYVYYASKLPSENEIAFYPNFSSKNCTEILLRNSTDTTRLVKRGKDWFVTETVTSPRASTPGSNLPQYGEYPVDTSLSQAAIKAIGAMNKLDFIAQTSEKQAVLEVDTMTGLYVECRDTLGKVLGATYIGKSDADYKAYFARPRGSDSIFIIPNGRLRDKLFAMRDRWMDKTIVAYDESKVVALEIANRDSAVIDIVKIPASATDSAKRGTWEIIQPVKALAYKKQVEFVLNKLVNMKAVAFENNPTLNDTIMGFTNPWVTLTVTLDNGEKRSVMIGNEKVAMRWIKNPSNKAVFTVYGYGYDGLNSGLESLLAKDTVKP